MTENDMLNSILATAHKLVDTFKESKSLKSLIGLLAFIAVIITLVTSSYLMIVAGIVAGYLIGALFNLGPKTSYFKSGGEIEKALERLTSQMNTRIKAVIVGGVKSPDTWGEIVAKKLKEAKNDGKPMDFLTVMFIDPDAPPIGFSDAVEKRFKLFEDKEVNHMVELRIFDMKPPLGIDFIIVDHNHILFLFPSGTVDREADFENIEYRGALVENDRDFVRCFEDWFNEIYAMKQTVPFRDWITKLR